MKKKFIINRRNFLKILSFLILFPNIAFSKVHNYMNKKLIIKKNQNSFGFLMRMINDF